MADPFTLALTVAVNLASMALTAMTKHEGPRLQDLAVTVADYGTPVPYLEGQRRIECPVMHAEPLRERKTTNKTKGGKYTEYKYYGTWASLICGNETSQLIRIWGDRHLLYDVNDPRLIRQAPKLKLGRDFRFYTGSEDQLPDERIAARIARDEGSADLTPAYRGISFVMFEDVPLEHFGNRLPQISIEASANTQGFGEGRYDLETITDHIDSAAPGGEEPGFYRLPIWISPDETYAVTHQIPNGSSSVVSMANLVGLSLVDKADINTIYSGDDYHIGCVDDEGSVWALSAGVGGRVLEAPLGQLDAPVHRFTLSTGGAGENFGFTTCESFTLPNGQIYIVLSQQLQNNDSVASWDFHTYNKSTATYTQHFRTWRVTGAFQDDIGDVWICGVPIVFGAGVTTAHIERITNVTGANPYASGDQVFPALPSISSSPVLFSNTAIYGGFVNGAFVGAWQIGGASGAITESKYLLSLALDGSLATTYQLLEQPTDTDYYVGLIHKYIPPNSERITLGVWSRASGSVNDSRAFQIFSTATLELTGGGALEQWQDNLIDPGDNLPNGWAMLYSRPAYLGMQQATAFFEPDNPAEPLQSVGRLVIYEIPGTQEVTLGSICRRVAIQTGMLDEDFNFDDLDQPVYGFSWVQGTARDIVTSLLEFHDSDIRPNGFIQQGIKRGERLSGPMITYDWMVRQRGEDGGGEPLYRVIAMSESDLPRRLQVVFSEIEREQQPNTAVAQRNGESVWTTREVPVDLTSLAISANDIQPMSERALRRQWIGAVTVENSLTPRDMALMPGQTRNLGLEDGVVIRSRLIRQTIRPNRAMVMRWERDGAVPIAQTDWEDDEGSLISDLPDSPGAIPGGRPPPSIFDPVDSVGWVLDIPLLSDADERTAPFVYFAGSPAEGPDDEGNDPDWSGLTILASDSGDPESFEEGWEVIASSDRATWGTAGTVLGPAIHTVVDEASELLIEMVEGSLETVDMADLLLDGTLNLAIVGDELIQFGEAVIQSGGQYVCRRLLRGRRGTERHIGTHQLGERFILCNDVLGIHSMGASEIADTDYYKFVTNGFDPTDYEAEPLTFTAEAHRPLSPVHVTVTRSGNDYIIDGMRRTRIGGGSINGQDVPLGEVSELYRVRVLDPDYEDGIAMRETTSLPFTYTEAMLVEDIGSVPAELTISICQMSPALSLEGHATEATGS